MIRSENLIYICWLFKKWVYNFNIWPFLVIDSEWISYLCILIFYKLNEFFGDLLFDFSICIPISDFLLEESAAISIKWVAPDLIQLTGSEDNKDL